MSKTKRAFSAFLAAAMLAALAAPAALATKSFSSTGSDQTDYLDCELAIVASVDTCSTIADGLSLIQLAGDTISAATPNGDSDADVETAIVTVSGATLVSATGATISGNSATFASDEVLDDAATKIVVRAPATAGSATVTVSIIDPVTLVAQAEGTLTLTFTASSGLQVSEANSIVKIVARDNCDNNADADDTDATATTIALATAVTNRPATGGTADVCIIVRNANGDPVDAEQVRLQITPVGLVGSSQTATVDPGANGLAIFELNGSGVPGTSTIAITVTENNVTTSFAARTFVWAGSLATLTLSNEKFVGTNDGSSVEALKLVGKDSGGNTVTPSGVTWQVSGGTGGVAAPTDGDSDGLWEVICTASAQGTYTFTAKSGSVTSNSVTYTCSPAANPATDTWTLAFDKANVAPGGSAKLCATFKNALGLPVPDGSYAIADSGKLVSSGALGSFSTTSNGAACATFLAPFAPGQVSAVVTPGGLIDPSSRTATITVGAPATSAGSALGIAPNGPFTTTTKVQVRGRYVTFRFDLGAAAANKPVTILAATKTGTTWSGFAAVTTRIANAQGVVIYYARQSSATWKSYRAQETTTNVTPARQARWT